MKMIMSGQTVKFEFVQSQNGQGDSAYLDKRFLNGRVHEN